MSVSSSGELEWGSQWLGKKLVQTLVCFCGRLPVLCADDGQAHLTLLINVGVVYLGLKANLRRLEGVLGRKIDLDAEGAFVVWRVVLKTIIELAFCELVPKKRFWDFVLYRVHKSIYEIGSVANAKILVTR